MSAVFLGVDAGGSHTTAVVTDQACKLLARETGPAGALRPGKADESAQVIAAVARAALAGAGASAAAAMVAGVAGAGREDERAALESALKRLALATHVSVTTDAAIALQAAFHDGPGILLISGSGSIGYARDPAGTVRRVGGLGWQMGDEGSGYALVHAALGAVGKAADGRGPETALTAALSEALNAPTLHDLIRWAQSSKRAEVAALAASVSDVAAAGDQVAIRLVDACAADLADHISALLRRFERSGNVPVALAGGMLAPGSFVRATLIARLRRVEPTAAVSQAPVDAPLGAAELASRLVPHA
jgi:N-acetylglucosamine kinase-like BadF-type ATPase